MRHIRKYCKNRKNFLGIMALSAIKGNFFCLYGAQIFAFFFFVNKQEA